LPSLFASAVARGPARKGTKTSTTASKGVSDKGATASPGESWKRDRQPTKPPLTSTATSDSSANVPSMFKSVASSSSNRRSPSPASHRNTASLSPGKYKSKSGKIVYKKGEDRERESSMTQCSTDSMGTGSSSRTPPSDTAQSSLPPVSHTKSKIKIKSRSSGQLEYKYNPCRKGRDDAMKAISTSTMESKASLSSPDSNTKPKSLKFIRAEKKEGERKSASFNKPTERNAINKGKQEPSPKQQTATIKPSIMGKGAVSASKDGDTGYSPKKTLASFRITKEPKNVATPKVAGSRCGAAPEAHVSSRKIFSEDPPGTLIGQPVMTDVKQSASVTKEALSTAGPSPPAKEEDVSTPLKKIVTTTSPKKANKYTGYTSTVPRSKNRVVAVTPFSAEKRSWPPTETAPTKSKMTPPRDRAPPHQAVSNNGNDNVNEGTKENVEKEKLSLVTIDTSGGKPEMIISFDNDEYNPIDEDELSCSVATAMFGPTMPSPSNRFSIKDVGGTAVAPSDPAAIVSLLSQEEQLELFKTLEKIHREKSII
jgi:hypothetical protein